MQTSVPLSTLLPPKDNPRRTLDQTLIAGLAQSIKTDGVLQNLLVRPEGEGQYRVIFGKRRYLALQHLKKRGDIDGGYEVPVEIKDGLDEGDALRLATVENVQREQLHPMDEAEAFGRRNCSVRCRSSPNDRVHSKWKAPRSQEASTVAALYERRSN